MHHYRKVHHIEIAYRDISWKIFRHSNYTCRLSALLASGDTVFINLNFKKTHTLIYGSSTCIDYERLLE